MVADDDNNNPVTGMAAHVRHCSSRRHFGHWLAAEPLLNKLRKEIGEWHDVLPHACLFQSGHVGVAPFQRHHCPGVTACREHHVHEEPADTAIAVHIGMDIDEDEMAEHDPH